MGSSQDKRTTAENLEGKFDRGEDVLDYFDVRKARVVDPQSKAARETSLLIRQSAIPNLPQWFVRNQRGIAERNRVPLSPVSDI